VQDDMLPRKRVVDVIDLDDFTTCSS